MLWVGQAAAIMRVRSKIYYPRTAIYSLDLYQVPQGTPVYPSSPGRAFMFYGCSEVTNGYMLHWHLFNPSSDFIDKYNAEYRKCTNNTSSDITTTAMYTNYGMRAGKFIRL